MLVTAHPRRAPARQQRGVVLFLALIVLVAMLLGGIALFRTMDASLLTVGNISLQRNATRSGDAGVEVAVAWLNAAGTQLITDNPAQGYMTAGLTAVKASNQTWAEYWTQLSGTYTPVVLAEDAAGNTASYMIQRLCTLPGQPYSGGSGGVPPVECIEPPRGKSTGSSMSAGFIALNRPSGTYYRVLVRTAGPRNVTSFLQVMIFM